MAERHDERLERERLERELASLRERVRAFESNAIDPNLRSLAAQIPDNIILLDKELRIRFINWTVPDLTVEQVIGTHAYLYVPEPHRATVRAAQERVLETGEPVTFAVDYVADDKSVSKWESRLTPWLRDGEVDGVIVVGTNITERNEAAADRDRFFSLAADMLCVATLEGKLKRTNPAFGRVLGRGELELDGRAIYDFVHADDLPHTRAAIATLRDSDASVHFENRCRSQDGSYRTLEWRAIAQHELGLFYGCARDVTDQRALEDRLRQSQKMDAVGHLAGGVAHDFNNLLQVIMMNTDVAVNAATLDVARGPLLEVQRTARTAADLTQQLLSFSRTEPLQRSTVDLNVLTRGLVGMLRRTIPATIDIVLTTAPDLPSIVAEPRQIEQLLLNLCINARDAIRERGRIAIETRGVTIDDQASSLQPWLPPRGRYALLTVHDDGAGMSDDVRDRAFEPFFTTKPRGEGTGLGLTMVYGIVQQHRGVIHLETQPGKGTTFYIYLPANEQAKTISRVTPRLAPAVGGSETILVADDTRAVRTVVERVLTFAGYTVLVAADGREAIDIVKARDDIDLALLDIVMPGMTGPEAAQIISELRPKLPMLFTTGYVETGVLDAPHTIELIRKPYRPDELLARIRGMLDGRDAPSASASHEVYDSSATSRK